MPIHLTTRAEAFMFESVTEMSTPIFETALILADQAAKTSSAYFRLGIDIDFKGDDSPVTIADKQIEREARDHLGKVFPDHAILGEEYGSGDLTNDHVWVIDPIDGTRSFISGNPLYGFLLAFMHRGQCELGLISMPALKELYLGRKGKGATLNGEPIRTSNRTKLSDAIIYINEGEKLLQYEPAAVSELLKIGHTRRFAYDCYSHALVASGQIDAVVDYDLKPFDYLPLAGVIEEAGGVISDWQGKPLNYNSDGRVITAATPELHKQLVDLLA